MAIVVMLTALAGEGIDIVAGDRCECSPEQATRFLAFGYARELCKKGGDDGRPLKSLVGAVQSAGDDSVPVPAQSAGNDSVADQTPTPKPKPKRGGGKKEVKDANKDRTQG